MAWRFALLLSPLPADDARSNFSSTFSAVDPAAAVLEPGELSTQRGDGVFETLGVTDGHAHEVQAHVERLVRSARLCDLPEPNLAQWHAAITSVAARCPAGDYMIKLVLSRGAYGAEGPTAWLKAMQAPAHAVVRSRGIRVVTLTRSLDSDAAARAPWLQLGAKTLSYATNMAAIGEAKKRGADDALFVSSDGVVLEGPTSSLMVRQGSQILTPAPGAGILHGTTQISLFSYLAARGYQTAYTTIAASDLEKVDAAWLVSSVRRAAPVAEIDGRSLTVDAELTASLNDYLLSPRI